MTYLREELAQEWLGQNPLDAAFALEGEVYREVAGRRTIRTRIGGQEYFVKLHEGVGIGEIVKNWLQLKTPIVGARNEYLACRDLDRLGIPAPVPAAFAEDTALAPWRRSFVACDVLTNRTTLEDLTAAWLETPPTPRLRRRVLDAVADFARAFHDAGFVHRDFYLCHLLADNDALAQERVELAVLDLHRAQRFEALPDRWRKRDLAALLFSALDLELTTQERLRFLARYTGRPLRQELTARQSFWQAVLARADRLYAEGQRKGIVLGRYRPAASK